MVKQRKDSYMLFGIIGIVVVCMFMMLARGPTVIVKDGSVRFDSIRKHPFDVLADPYHPPERTNPYLFGRDYSYQQVGFLEGGSGMLPLFGRPHPDSTNRWEYYTMNGSIKLPISIGKKQCNSDTGCSEIMGNKKGDLVDVMGLGSMKSFLYDTEQLRR